MLPSNCQTSDILTKYRISVINLSSHKKIQNIDILADIHKVFPQQQHPLSIKHFFISSYSNINPSCLSSWYKFPRISKCRRHLLYFLPHVFFNYSLIILLTRPTGPALYHQFQFDKSGWAVGHPFENFKNARFLVADSKSVKSYLTSFLFLGSCAGGAIIRFSLPIPPFLGHFKFKKAFYESQNRAVEP